MRTKVQNSLSLINIFHSNLYEFLSFSIELMKQLETIKSNIKIINPENIFVQKKNDTYGIYFDFNQELDPFAKDFYISPELKKEINRESDQRSILYSIGIIFHLLLTKQYPTISSGIHINFSTNEFVPQAIQLIIEKLICRYPEDRYQSVNGLKSDLVKAKDDYDKTGDIKPFYPGIDDKPIDLKFSNYLYGRSHELNALSFAETNFKNKIKTNLFIVHGPSGIGKTFLVDRSIEKITKEHVITIKYKCEQFDKVQFQTIKKIISELTKTSNLNFLNDIEKQKISKLKKKFENINLYLNPSNKSTKEKSNQNYSDLSNITIDLITIFSKYCKIILYIDDIQWIDNASLNPVIATAGFIENNLIIIGTSRKKFNKKQSLINYFYESNQKPPETIINAFNSIKTNIIALPGLKKEEIKEQVEDLLLCNDEESEKLSMVLLNKTEGNPLYIQQLLVSFKERNLMWFDNKKNEWIWKLSEMALESVTDDVANLLINKIKTLPTQTQKALHFASLLNNTFELDFLSKIMNQDLITLELNLWHAITKKLIVEIPNNNKTSTYKFLHDKIQSACLEQNEFKNAESNATIGRCLLKEFEKDKNNEKLALVIHHLNEGITYLSNKEILQLIELNENYGSYLLKYRADSSAEKYYSKSIEIYQTYSINKPTKLEKLYFSKVNACQLAGQFDTALDTLKLIENNPSLQAKLNNENILLKTIDILMLQSNYKLLITIGIDYLKKSNQKLKIAPSSFETIRLFSVTFIKLLINLNKISQSNKKTSKEDIFISKLYCEMTGGTYFFNKNTYIQLLCSNILFTLKKGTSEDTPFLLTLFSNVLLIKFNQYKISRKLSEIANTIKQHFKESKYTYQTEYLDAIFMARWFEPVSSVSKKLTNIIQKFKEINEITFSTYAITQNIYYLIISGEELIKIKEVIDEHYPFIYTIGFSDTMYSVEIATAFLNSQQNDTTDYISNNFNEKKHIPELLSKGLIIPCVMYYILKQKTMYYAGQSEEAILYGKEAEKHIESHLGLITVEEHYLYYGLSLIDVASRQHNLSTNNAKMIRKCIKLYKKWSDQNKNNYKAKYLLLKGSFHEYNNQTKKAIECYSSISHATDQINIEALALEKLAHLTFKSNINYSKKSLKQAIKCYKKWGSQRKTSVLSNELQKKYY